MANSDETLAGVQAEMERLRATLSQQQELITQQQSAIAALQRTTGLGDAPQLDQSTQTSRRGFLGAAALGAAAATAATVAVVGATPAHAATGSAAILGQANDANATTQFNVTSGASLAAPVVLANNPTSGASTPGIGVQGQANNGIGVYGFDPGGNTGVSGYAQGPFGVGVEGDSDYNIGVLGLSPAGPGVLAISGSWQDITAAGTGRIYQNPQAQQGPAVGANTIYVAGESIRDSNGDLWLCINTSGSGGSVLTDWVKVAHLAPGITTGGGISYLAKPIRLLDTRAGQPAFITPGAPYAPGTHTLQVGGDSYNGVTVPTGLAGAIGNVTVVNPQGSGYLALVPKGAGNTGAAVLAFNTGQVVSNSYNVGLATDAMDILLFGASTDVIVDLFSIVA